ncbi:MAG TPA: hypothetical protein VK203_03515 [Nostocaceae cyanobacterium]|nr:hypothetical protein [Nostocaceae cyanobacterium]
MVYTALRWDNRSQESSTYWLVVESKEAQEQTDGTITLPSRRRHIAYFVNQDTAEQDAKQFAEYKNEKERCYFPSEYLKLLASNIQPRHHAAFECDVHFSSGSIYWAVQECHSYLREDIAYFFDSLTAKEDAKAFSLIRDHRLELSEIFLVS